MRNTNNKSLNDHFRAARDEVSTEIISDREAEQLLVNGTMRSLPTEQTIGQRLYELLFSTPLKIGITTMTTATCIALGVFAFWPQTPTNNIIAHHQTNPSYGTYGSHGTHESHGMAAVAAPNSLPQMINDQAPAFHKAEILPSAPIATADSLHPIELSTEQLAQLGIVLEDNGDIDFYTKSGSSGEVNKFGLPPSWGVRLHLGEKISETDIAGLTIPKSAPRLVTAMNGAKRLFSFESDTTIAMKGRNKSVLMHMQSHTSIAPGESSHSAKSNRVMIRVAGGSNSESNVEVSNVSDSLPRGTQHRIQTRVEVQVNDSSINNTVNESLNNFAKEMGSIDMDSVMTSINMDSIFASLNLDSVVKSVKPGIHGHCLDSVLNEAHKALPNLKKIVSSMRIRMDSSNKPSNTSLSIEMNANVDDTTSGARRVAEEIEDEDINIDNDTNDDTPGIPPTPPIPPFQLMEQAANSINLDHLIPIRVRNMKNAAHPNELIFWYEPTPEITAAIPEASVSTPTQSKQLAISVYPNPTNGPATIHFDLAGAPKAYFSVRNLLGQQVLDGGSASGSSGDMKLDLSSLDAGVYLLVTTTDDGERDVERVVVAK